MPIRKLHGLPYIDGDVGANGPKHTSNNGFGLFRQLVLGCAAIRKNRDLSGSSGGSQTGF